MEPIAIVGLALKFSREADLEHGLWRVLMRKKLHNDWIARRQAEC